MKPLVFARLAHLALADSALFDLEESELLVAQVLIALCFFLQPNQTECLAFILHFFKKISLPCVMWFTGRGV